VVFPWIFPSGRESKERSLGHRSFRRKFRGDFPVRGTCQTVPGTGWHVPCTELRAAKSLWLRDFGA